MAKTATSCIGNDRPDGARTPRGHIPARPAHARARGFSLLELTLVLSLALLLLGIAVPWIGRQLPGVRLDAAVRELATHARLARNLAVAQNNSVRLIIDVDRRAYRLSSEASSHRLPGQPTLTLYAPESERLDEHTAAIRFYGDGSSTGGRITFVEGGRQRAVDVQWLTGKVSVHE